MLELIELLSVEKEVYSSAYSSAGPDRDSGGHSRARLDPFTGSSALKLGPAVPEISCGWTACCGRGGGTAGDVTPICAGIDRKLPIGMMVTGTILRIFGFINA